MASTRLLAQELRKGGETMRKDYEEPKLLEFGTIAELTRIFDFTIDGSPALADTAAFVPLE